MIAVFVIGILVAAFSPESARPQAGIAPVGKEMASAPDKPVSLTLTEAGAQTGKASVQSAFQATLTAKAVSAGVGSRYTGGGVTTSSTARYSTGLAVDDSGQPWSGDREVAGGHSGDACETVVFWLALLILVCVAVLFIMVTVHRGKKEDPHEKTNF
jgi:hypothetical protein